MTFLWPEALGLLATLPVLVALYVLLLRRTKKAALRYASLSMVKEAMAGPALRRHVPPLIFLLALVAGFFALDLKRPPATNYINTSEGPMEFEHCRQRCIAQSQAEGRWDEVSLLVSQPQPTEKEWTECIREA
jgi:hypothetical protein